MKNLILIFLVIGIIMIFWGCQEDSSLAPVADQSDQAPAFLAKAKPSPNLIGTTYCPFTFTPPTFWNGTIDFGVDGGEHSITFISYDPPREYSQASPFYEDFVIYKLNTDWENPDNVYMKGWNAGVVTNANNPPDDPSKFRANGKITEAYGPFEEWQDCNVHVSGLVYWVAVGLPEKAVGTFRIN